MSWPRAVRMALVTALLAGLCVAGSSRVAAPHQAVQAALDRQAAAVLHGDRSAYLAEVDPRASGYRERQRRVVDNLHRLPLARFSYRVRAVDAGRGRAEAQLRYRLRGPATATVTAEERYRVVRRGTDWYLAGELPDSARQLWDEGRLRVVSGRHSVVLGSDRRLSELRSLARVADRAVPAVSRVWPERWRDRVVVEVPRSTRQLARMLGQPAGGYTGIAAVTAGSTGAGERPGGDRVLVNPEAFPLLSRRGQQLVMTHETTHVATRERTGPTTPMWLSEGFADWVGYRGTGVEPRQAAPELTEAVHGRTVPERLPGGADFRFGADANRMARAYEGSWLACRMVARQWGEARLVELYQRVGRGESADRALRRVLDVDQARFTQRWRDYLREELG
ncbi:hypothetical protein [Streptomyces sp. NPDC005438]|uniref:hypothetical protein n=1 Tax=Streptomyces sp. NPDC005438 TaxID=3156880 RepID=UPI0033B45A9B